MTDIIIQGIHGRMGRALCTMIEARTDCRVVAGVDAKELQALFRCSRHWRKTPCQRTC